MQGAERALKVLAFLTLTLMLAVYYGRGLSFQMWGESGDYLIQARGLAGLATYARPSDRSIGYPSIVALSLLTPRPALALVLMQVTFAAAAFAGLYRALVDLVLPRVGLARAMHPAAKAAVLVGVALASLYSPIHVLIAALLGDILMAALALAAVLAVTWLLLPDRNVRHPWIEAPAAAAVAALPLLMRPEWALPAAVLALAAGLWLWRATLSATAGRMARGGRLLAALAVTIGAAGAVTHPDRIAAARAAEPANAFLEGRRLLCNHAHLLERTLQRRPGLMLLDDPLFEHTLRAKLETLVARYEGDWPLLGFNGENCTHDPTVIALLDRRYPEADGQGRAIVGALARAVLADPLPYAEKVAGQIAYGFTTAFSRFAMHGRPGHWVYRVAEGALELPPSYHAGIWVQAEVGPLGTRAMLDHTWSGKAVKALLAAVFHAAGLLMLVPLASVAWAGWRWRAWSAAERQTYLAIVGVPLAALVAHHVGVGLFATYDQWRLAAGLYFVNLLAIGGASLLWLGDWKRWRASSRAGSANAGPRAISRQGAWRTGWTRRCRPS